MTVARHLVVILMLLLSGCATFRDGANPPITKWPPPDLAPEKKSVALQLTGSAIVNGSPADVNPKFLEKWREQVVTAYQSSGLFSEIKVGTEPADIRAEVNITDNGEGSKVLAFITGFTLFIVPCHVREGFIVKTTYLDNAGTPLGTFEKTEFADMWMQLFLLPVTPFKPPSEFKEMLYDLNRNTLIEAHGKGLF